MATTTAATETAAAPRNDHRWAALGVIALAQLMVALDATIVNVALPTAQQVLGLRRRAPLVRRHGVHALLRRAAPARRQDLATGSVGAGR